MKQIQTIKDLELFSGQFVSFRLKAADYQKETCLKIKGKRIARISTLTYPYHGEKAYQFSCLRNNKKFDYCYLADSLLKQIKLELNLLSKEDVAEIQKIIQGSSKFAGEECVFDGCKLDLSSEADGESFSFKLSLDDNIMLGTVIGYFIYRIGYFFNQFFGRKGSSDKKKVLLDQNEDDTFFKEKINEVLKKIDEAQSKLQHYVADRKPTSMQWAFHGLENYREDIKKLQNKYQRGLAKKKFDKVMGIMSEFSDNIITKIALKEQKEKRSTPQPPINLW